MDCKRIMLGVNLLLLLFGAQAQLNMSLASQLRYDSELNDVWGYVAPDGTEYALVGKVDGVSIVSLAEPNNAVEVASIDGEFSVWRDLKTFGTYCYVVTDGRNTTEGLTVIDMSNLPNSIDFFHWTPELVDLGQLTRCHNLYIDDNGIAYLSGCSINAGGMIYIDVASTPGTPQYIGQGPSVYSHDVYVQDDVMYASELNRGQMALYDVSDLDDTRLLGTVNTPFNFTHNIWVDGTANVAYTTDERPNAPVAAYDITDPEEIFELDQYRPTATLGDDVIPHNVHVWNDWLIISYYSDGGIVVDASRPDNLVEVGNFDTFFGVGADFQGTWGAYPFLPSGLVLLTDITSGLYVLNTEYVRAAFLEGTVTDASTGQTLNDVRVVIDSDTEENINFSRIDGTYGTGLATAGTYQVEFAKAGYQRAVMEVTINNGEVTMLDVALTPLNVHTFSGTVFNEQSGEAIPFAHVIIRNDLTEFQTQADENGTYTFFDVPEEAYQQISSIWGYVYTVVEDVMITDGGDDYDIGLNEGYADNFIFNYRNWGTTAIGEDIDGRWEWGEPRLTSFNRGASNPSKDVQEDFGDKCYVTGNGGGGAGSDDVDDGLVILTTPEMRIRSLYESPVVTYRPWFFNSGGDGNPQDTFSISVTNGVDTVLLEEITNTGREWRDARMFGLDTIIAITDTMHVIFTAGDTGAGHLVEAGVDDFAVLESSPAVSVEELTVEVDWQVMPNPFEKQFFVNYAFQNWGGSGELAVYNAVGQQLWQQVLQAPNGQAHLQNDWPKGLYYVQLSTPGFAPVVQKVVKQ